MKKRLTLLIITSILSSSAILAQKKPDFLTTYNEAWVETTLKNLTIEEKIGQLLMPRGNTSGKGYEPEKVFFSLMKR